MSRVSFFSITVISVVKNMSSESKITLPPSVENQIDTFFKKDEFEAYQELAEIFKQAVLQKSDVLKRQSKKNNLFTLSKIITLLGINNINRSRQFRRILQNASEYDWSEEMVDSIKPKLGGKQDPCEIWFTPYGFIRCFHTFPRNKFSKAIINLSCKVLGWVMITQGEHHAKLTAQNQLLIEEVDVGYEQVEELAHELEQTQTNLEETQTNLEETQTNLQETNSDLVAREESPWKEFCALKGLPENYKRWGRRKAALYRLFASARDAGYTAKREGTCWYYVSEAGRTSALNSWE